MEFAPDGRLFVLEQGGSVRVIKNGALLSTPFLTLTVSTDSERGLLGIAFDPNFSANRFVYLYYTRSTSPIKNRVSRFTASSTNGDVVQAGSELILLDNIASDAGNHNGGAIHFGADGKLYVAVGDGGTTHTSSQDFSSLSGKILRVNSDGSIPTDNPFFNQAGAQKEIWALGLRNPFTFAFDPTNGKLHINDVGQDTFEEINLGVKGANYGWPTCEGTCSDSNFTNPIYFYDHSVGQAITGGAFYRASEFPSQYNGVYFFSDYLRGFIHYLDSSNQEHDFTSAHSPVDLKVGADGALYYASIGDGQVYKIAFENPTPLSDLTALTASIATAQSKYNAAVEGSLAGQYPSPLKANLQSAINTASAITSASSQSVVDAAVITLNTAITTFEAGKVPPPAPDTTAPVITLNGANPMSLTAGNAFSDPGATALDAVDGVVTVTPSGSVDSSVAGAYTITYTAEDTADNISTTTRIVNVVAVTQRSRRGGGGGGGRRNSPITPTAVATPVIIPGCDVRTTGFSVINGQSCFTNIPTSPAPTVATYNFGPTTLRLGSRGEFVKELQRFLNKTMNLGLVVDGVLGEKSAAVIRQWQKDRGLVADGLVGPMTKMKMNLEI